MRKTDRKIVSGETKSEKSSRITPSESLTDEKLVPQESQEVDYIRKYQYKKVDGNPTVGGAHTDPDVGSKAEAMKKFSLEQPKIRMIVPAQEGGDSKVPLSVNLNGYRLDFPRNTYIEMPENFATVVMESQRQQEDALKPFQIEKDSDKDIALS